MWVEMGEHGNGDVNLEYMHRRFGVGYPEYLGELGEGEGRK